MLKDGGLLIAGLVATVIFGIVLILAVGLLMELTAWLQEIFGGHGESGSGF